jgi:hypothetical protein
MTLHTGILNIRNMFRSAWVTNMNVVVGSDHSNHGIRNAGSPKKKIPSKIPHFTKCQNSEKVSASSSNKLYQS